MSYGSPCSRASNGGGGGLLAAFADGRGIGFHVNRPFLVGYSA